jgi:IS66 C-terminal element
VAADVVFGAVGVERDFRSFEHHQQFGFVGVKPRQQPVEDIEAGAAPEIQSNLARKAALLIETSKLLDVEPHGYLADVITRIVNDHPQSSLDDLLPWAYPATPQLRAVA